MAFGDLIPAADTARLVASPREALAGIKAGLRRGETSDFAGALAFEAERQDVCFHSPDFAEGVAAFLGKRPPRYGA